MLKCKPTHEPIDFRRQSRFLRFSALGLALGFALEPVVCTANAPRGYWTYTVTDLGDFGGGISRANAINYSGQVVGWSNTVNGHAHAFLFVGGQIRDLGTLPGFASSTAQGINDSGQIVGWSGELYGNSHAFLYTGSQMQDLGGGLGGTYNQANGINSLGVVVGTSTDSAGFVHGVSYYGGQVLQLPLYNANGVNKMGQIVGYGSEPNNDYRDAFAYNPVHGLPVYLGGLSGIYNTALSINNSGQVVGWSWMGVDATNTPIKHAFLYDGWGYMQDLGTLGGESAVANTINDNGVVVGWSDTASGAQHAFEYSSRQLLDLNNLASDPSWILQSANGINSSGQIVGWGTHNGQGPRAFLFTPVFHYLPPVLGR
jgi:probable HAF family extracellular repeat protein